MKNLFLSLFACLVMTTAANAQCGPGQYHSCTWVDAYPFGFYSCSCEDDPVAPPQGDCTCYDCSTGICQAYGCPCNQAKADKSPIKTLLRNVNKSKTQQVVSVCSRKPQPRPLTTTLLK